MIQEDSLKNLLELAKVDVTEDELKALQNDMSSIIEYVDQISSVQVPDEVPVSHHYRNVTRADSNPHAKGYYTEKILKEVPDSEGDYIKVSRILK